MAETKSTPAATVQQQHREHIRATCLSLAANRGSLNDPPRSLAAIIAEAKVLERYVTAPVKGGGRNGR